MNDRVKKHNYPVGSGDIFFGQGALPKELNAKAADALVRQMRERVQGELPENSAADDFTLDFVAAPALDMPSGIRYHLPQYAVSFFRHQTAGVVVVKDGCDHWDIKNLAKGDYYTLSDSTLEAITEAINHVIDHPNQIGYKEC